MNLGQFLLILRARWRIAAFTVILITGLALGISLGLDKQYTATTTLLVDIKTANPVANVNLPALAMPGYMSTQVDIIKSDSVAERVVELTGLEKSPAMKSKWQQETEGRGSFRRWIAELLEKRVSVRPARESNVIELSYTAVDPDFAVAIADMFAKAYVETSVSLSVEPAQQYSAFFQQKLEEKRSELEAAQKRLAEYQQTHGIVARDERLEAENQKLSELQTQYLIALGQDVDSSSKRGAGGGTDTLPEVLQSPVVSQLKSQIATTQAKLQDLGGNLGHNHPQYQATEAELASLKQQLAEETARVSHGVDTVGRIGQGKAAALRAQMDEVKHRLLEIKRTRGEMDVLQQELDSAQKAYEAVSTRNMETHIQSQSTQTNVVVLSKAAAPAKPSSPRILLNTVLGLLVGLILGIGAALARELSDRRVLCAADLAQLPGFQILAELPAR